MYRAVGPTTTLVAHHPLGRVAWGGTTGGGISHDAAAPTPSAESMDGPARHPLASDDIDLVVSVQAGVITMSGAGDPERVAWSAGRALSRMPPPFTG
jgi:hypothetical protein